MSESLDELEKTVLRFGIHKGKTFDECPLTYLDWLMGTEWLEGRFPFFAQRLAAYLRHPTIAGELEEELGKAKYEQSE